MKMSDITSVEQNLDQSGILFSDIRSKGEGVPTSVSAPTNGSGNGAPDLASRSFSDDGDAGAGNDEDRGDAPRAPAILSVTDDVAPLTGPLINDAHTDDPDLTVRVSLAGTRAEVGDRLQLYEGTGTSRPLDVAHRLREANVNDGYIDVQTGTLRDGTTYAITARLTNDHGHQSGASNSFSLTEDASAVCYVRGTHLATLTGERKIEDLNAGDMVVTLRGADRVPCAVKWIGRRRIDLTKHRRPETVAPVCISAGAIGENIPHRNLYVSPDHAIFIDGKLICARQLVNGTTIRWETGRTSVEYFHVALDGHAIILAEGLSAESYLETGNGGFFADSGMPLTLHPNLTNEEDYPARDVGSCAPFVCDQNDVRPVWQCLVERAAELGQAISVPETEIDPALRIIANDRTLRSVRHQDGWYTFVLPKGTKSVRVVSRAGALTDTQPWQEDRRRFGVYVERIVVRDGSRVREIPVDHPDLSRGWWAVDRCGVALHRWTAGDAVLPLPPFENAMVLEIRVSTNGMRYITNTGQSRAAA